MGAKLRESATLSLTSVVIYFHRHPQIELGIIITTIIIVTTMIIIIIVAITRIILMAEALMSHTVIRMKCLSDMILNQSLTKYN